MKRMLLIAVVPLMASGCFITDHIAPYAILIPNRCDDHETLRHFPKGLTPAAYGLKADTLSITVRDSIVLSGWFTHSALDSAFATIILVHGISSCKEHLLPAAELLAQEGYNTIVFDLPAHGKSGGTYMTFGYFERYDIKTAIDSVAAAYDSDIWPLAIFGSSLGGAIAIQTMAIDPRIRCGIIESSFATLPEIADDFLAQKIWLRLPAITYHSLAKAGEIADFNAFTVRPEASARKVRQPIMVVHGTQDEVISIEYGQRIFANVASGDKSWYPIEGAGHHDVWQIGGAEYKREFLRFLSKWLKGV